MTYAEQLATEVEYDENADGSVDALIAYKNTLEDTLDALEQALKAQGLSIERLLSAGP